MRRSRPARWAPTTRGPPSQPPPAYTYSTPDAQETANTTWWTQFEDPVLDGLIADALAEQPEREDRGGQRRGRRGRPDPDEGPALPAGRLRRERGPPEGERAGSPRPGTPPCPNPQDAFQLAGSASWELDLWGRVRRLSEAARADLFATEEARRGVVLSLVATVAGNYLQLRGPRRAARDRPAEPRHLRRVRPDLRAPVQARPRLPDDRRAGADAVRDGGRGDPPDRVPDRPDGERPVDPPRPAPGVDPPGEVGSRPRDAGRSRRACRRASSRAGPTCGRPSRALVAANARIGAAKALYFPTISLTGVLGTASADLSNLFKGPAGVWSYAGSITGPLFAGGAIKGAVRQTEAGRKAALLAYQNARSRAPSPTWRTPSSRGRSSLEETEARARLVQAAREYERLATLQYKGGYAPYSTVLQAQEKLFPAELDWARARTSLLGSLVSIYRAMGGGWVTEAERLTIPPEANAAPQVARGTAAGFLSATRRRREGEPPAWRRASASNGLQAALPFGAGRYPCSGG